VLLFNQSVIELLAPGNVDMIGKSERVGSSEGQGGNAALLPVLKVKKFHFRLAVRSGLSQSTDYAESQVCRRLGFKAGGIRFLARVIFVRFVWACPAKNSTQTTGNTQSDLSRALRHCGDFDSAVR
jgi:hypothetical protein